MLDDFPSFDIEVLALFAFWAKGARSAHATTGVSSEFTTRRIVRSEHPKSSASSPFGRPSACKRITSRFCAGESDAGRPPIRPRAFAEASPSCTRWTRISRSMALSAAMTV